VAPAARGAPGYFAVMAEEVPVDLEALALELVQLERREARISAQRRKLQLRLASFPSDFARRQEREVSAERRAIHARIDELRAKLIAASAKPGTPEKEP